MSLAVLINFTLVDRYIEEKELPRARKRCNPMDCSLQQGFLTLDPTDILDQIIIGSGGCNVNCRIFISSITDLSTTCSSITLVVTT